MTDRLARYRDHLEHLYTFAQLLTADEETAAELVRTTLQTAASAPELATNRKEERVRLLQLLLRLHRPPIDYDVGDEGVSRDAPPEPLPELRARLCRRYVDRVLPVLFATLPSSDRLLLALCDAEHLSCMEAGLVLGIDAGAACDRLTALRRRLVDALHEAATPPERALLAALPADPALWLPDALRRLLEAELAPLPPTFSTGLAAPSAPTRGDTSSSPAARTTPRASRPDRRPPARSPQRLRRWLVAATLIVAAGFIGYGLSALAPHPEPPDVNLITLTARQAGNLTPAFHTPSPEQAERYLHDRLGRRITIPNIDQAMLLGVGQTTLVDGVEVPVLLYQDHAQDVPITVYAFSYAFLDRNRDRIRLERDILLQIESDRHFDLHDLGPTKALVWRNRDDIFIAITTGDAEALRNRIHFPT